MNVDNEKLMAFADGELGGEERAEIEAALASDARLRAQLAAHRRLRAQVSAAFDGALAEPVPARMQAAFEAKPGAEIVTLAERRRATWSAREWSAMAASIAAGLCLGIGFMTTHAPLIAPTAEGLVARGDLARALNSQLSSEEAGAVRIGLTFRDQDGGLCRTFDLTRNATSGLACREGDAWTVAMTAQGGGGGDMRMAGGAEEIMNAVTARISGDPLDADEESRARANDWR